MKKLILGLLIQVLVLSNFSIIFAKDLDLKNKGTKDIKPLLEIMKAGKILEVYNNKSNYLIEVGEKFYNVTDIDAATKNGTSIKDAVKDLDPVKEDSSTVYFEVEDIY